jgi:hypothetical protein
MFFKVLSGIPFLEQAENIFILHAMKEIPADAALFRPDGTEERGNRLGQFLALAGLHFHAYDDLDHILSRARSMPSGNSGRQEKGKVFISKGRGGNGENSK